MLFRNALDIPFLFLFLRRSKHAWLACLMTFLSFLPVWLLSEFVERSRSPSNVTLYVYLTVYIAALAWLAALRGRYDAYLAARARVR